MERGKAKKEERFSQDEKSAILSAPEQEQQLKQILLSCAILFVPLREASRRRGKKVNCSSFPGQRTSSFGSALFYGVLTPLA